MKRNRFTEEQIIGILKEHEAGVSVADLCRKHGVSDASIYKWKAKFGGINGLTLGLGPLLPEFLKDFTYKTKPVSFSFSPTLPTQTVLGRKIKPVLSENSAAFVLTGNPLAEARR